MEAYNNNLKAQVIAYYLSQFHSIPENDKWWGTGFTEWTNVKKARPLFKGHYQPRVPGDMGYYNLLNPETRETQARLAQESGVSAFCYWHYWFGNGKQLLEKPLQEVIRTEKPDFPFCLSWANHSWEKRNWNSSASHFSREILIEQEYNGIEDINNHFNAMLPMFRDKRYYKIRGKLVFVFYDAVAIPYLDMFIKRWQELSQLNGLPGFYFISHVRDVKEIEKEQHKLCDAINLQLLRESLSSYSCSKYKYRWKTIKALLRINIMNDSDYSKSVQKFNSSIFKSPTMYPTILPNWDTTPRRGWMGDVLRESTPEKFYLHAKHIVDLIKEKDENDRIIFLKSWNEWAEGNYLEPDFKYGHQYMHSLKKALLSNYP